MSGASRRPFFLPAILAVVCCLLLWLLRPTRVSEPEHALGGPSSSGAPHAAVPPSSATHVDKSGSPLPKKELVPLAAPAVDLPADTQKLAKEFVPGTTEWEEVPLLENTNVVIRVLPKRYNVIAPQPITVFVEIVDLATSARTKPDRAYVRLRPYDAKSDDWIEIAAVDDGTNDDEKAGDGRYTASLLPSGDVAKRLFGHVLVEGVVETKAAGVRRVPHTLIYTLGPRAKMTGKWRDARKDGHLIIEGECEVEESGLFSLMGQLVGPSNEPIALTRTFPPVKLEKGTHWITLRTWGKAIRDSGVDGPYLLRNVLLTRLANEKGDYDPGETIVAAHTTGKYSAQEFSADPWTAPKP
ncbi:MAG: choice-of-anchor X domain-containing protein [Polyangiales bacterium]